jgi:hypothetical protein
MRHESHLDDDRLMSIGLAGGREQDAGALEHLALCRDCDTRLRRIVRALDSDRREAADEVSSVFTPARLAAQRAQIMRRLDSVGRARVLEFPDRAARPVTRSRTGAAARWVAAAAVAGLVAGVGTGLLMDRRTSQSPAGDRRLTSTPLSVADDDLLGDIDQALVESPAIELRAIDAFTPVSHEVVFTSR